MDAVGAYVQAGLGLDTGSGARFYDGTLLTASMFHMLGVKPILGRGLAAADDKVGAPVVVLIGENLWRRQFHADRGVLGRKVRVSGQWATIVGVLPATFTFRDASELWMPLQLGAGMRSDVYMVARLAPGVRLAQARQQLDALDTHLRRASPEWRRQQQIVMQPLIRAMTDQDTVRWVWLMFRRWRAGVAPCLRECGQPAAGANLESATRTGVAQRAGLWPRAPFRRCAGREPHVERGGVGGGFADRAFRQPLAGGDIVADGKSPDAWMRFGIDGSVLVFGVGMALLSTALAGLVSAWRASRTDMQIDLARWWQGFRWRLRACGQGARGGRSRADRHFAGWRRDVCACTGFIALATAGGRGPCRTGTDGTLGVAAEGIR